MNMMDRGEADMDDLSQAPGRSGGRWAPGQSGNPAGKKPGTRNRASRLRELLADGDEALAAKVLMDRVRAGDGVAARFVLDRLFPKPRDREIDLGLPPPEEGTTLVEMFDRVLWLMAAGEITIDEASRMVRLFGERRHQGTTARLSETVAASERPAASAATAAATAAPPAFDLQTAGPGTAGAAPDGVAAAPQLNRHDRRRAAALARAARGPTLGPGRLTAAA
jgi:hypothetical protein